MAAAIASEPIARLRRRRAASRRPEQQQAADRREGSASAAASRPRDDPPARHVLTQPEVLAAPGATSRSVHCSRSLGRLRAAADEEQRAERVAARAATPWLPPPAWVTPPQSTASKPGASETTKSPACGARQRRADPGERVRVGLAAQAPVLDRRLEHAEVALELPAAAAQVGDLAAGPEAQLLAGALDHRHSPPAGGMPGSSRSQRRPVGALQPADQVDALDLGQRCRAPRRGSARSPSPGSR